MVLSVRFEDALVYASLVHRNQRRRKPMQIPYVSHLLGVASIVLEFGGDEDEAIAALLHDAPEDQGGERELEQIRSRFGDRVAAIVAGCSDDNARGSKT
jgi:(p)ppGpp synthase/HD superfamily hydrolase